LRAVNAAGVSGASNQSLVTAKGTPEAPSVSALVESDRGLTVLFNAPANGGTPITNYEYSLDGGTIWTTRSPASASAPLVLSGLVNGTSYSVRLRAVNAVGSGAASTTIVGTPRTTPSAPTRNADTIVGVDGALDVVFTAPISDGGSAIIDYEFSPDAGVSWRLRTTGFTASPLRITTLSSDGITPLTGGATYPVEIRAVNAAGPGLASAVASGITTTVPAAPVITGTTAYDSSAAIRFTNPAKGGAAILRFEYRLNGGTWVDTGSLSNEFVVAGLDNSSTYTVEVRAVNIRGDGPASAPASVSVRTTPGPPTIDAVTAGDRTLSVAFTAGNDGGAAITTYQYSTDGGSTWRTRSDGANGSPLLITNTSGAGAPQLANGTV
jgi:predicted RNA-binding protein with TRAM domain